MTVTSDDLSKIFLKNSGTAHEEVFKMISHCAEPTATFENVKTGEQETHAVNCLNIQVFTKLEEVE